MRKEGQYYGEHYGRHASGNRKYNKRHASKKRRAEEKTRCQICGSVTPCEVSMGKTLYLMCAFPGAGKGWWIDANIPNATICSADHEFIGSDGVYRFNGKRIGKAHENCNAKAEKAMANGDSQVVIDNTNLATWQMKSYLDMAAQFGYEVEIIRISANPDVAFANQAHNVPKAGHASMVKQFNKRDLPNGVKVREVDNFSWLRTPLFTEDSD